MRIDRIVNSFLQSNTFILSSKGENDVFVVDIGDVEPLMNLIGDKKVKGLFLTHAHYDHVYGINVLLEAFPGCIVYGSKATFDSLKNDKLNFSYYYEMPLLYKGAHEAIIKDGQLIPIWNNIKVRSIITPGHTLGSTCYMVDNNIFTGDAYIPNVPTVTKLKGGNKIEAEKSIAIIQKHLSEGDILHPGHLSQYKMINGKLELFCEAIE